MQITSCSRFQDFLAVTKHAGKNLWLPVRLERVLVLFCRCVFVAIFFLISFQTPLVCCQGDVWICMELMDTSLDKFYKQVIEKGMSIPEDILGKIAVSVGSRTKTLDASCERHTDMLPVMFAE